MRTALQIEPVRRAVGVLAVLLALVAPATAGVNQWTDTGPAQVVNVVVPGGVAGRFYAGSADGLYRSDSDGASWERLVDSLPGRNVLSIAVSSADPQRLYAGTQLGLYLSADGGASWTRADAPGSGIMALAVTPGAEADSERVFAGTFGRGVYVSADGGQTWARSADLIDAIVFALEPAQLAATTIYAGTARGLYVSRDAGASWAVLGQDLQDRSVRAVHQSTTDPDRLVVGTYGDGVLRSADGGVTWTPARSGLQPPQVRGLAVDDANPEVMYAATSTGGFYRTRDAGSSWLPVNYGLTSLSSRAVRLDPRDRNRLLGSGVGEGVWELRFAPEPQIAAVPASFDFGPVPVGSQVQRSLRLDNTGTADLVVAEVRLGGSSGFDVTAGGFVVPPGESQVVTVSFAPAVRDLILRDEIRFSSNDPDEPEFAVPVSGRGTRSVLSAAPSRIDFGRVPVPPGFADTTLTLTNTGSATLQLFAALFDDSRFKVLEFTPTALQPGRSVQVRVAFQPLLPQPRSSNLLLVSDSTPDTLRVPVTGTGTTPDITLSDVVLEFGRVDLGEARTLPLRVTNTGTADLTISRLAAGGDQFFVDRTLGVPRDTTFVVPAADTILVVAGGDTTLTLNTDASTKVQVRGDTTRLISAGDTTTIAAAGDTTTTVVVGGQRTVFAATEDSTVLAPDSSFTFLVTYWPTVSGTVRDTLRIASNAPIGFGQVDVVLRGEGNALSLQPAPALAVGVHPVDLAAVDVDGFAGPDLVVADSGSGQVHVLLNDGAGVFPDAGRRSYPTSASAYGPWVQPVAVAVAPVFGGSLPDLIVGDRVGRSLSLLRNDGSGRFDGRRDDIFIGHALADLLAQDLDTDGDVDIAVANGPDSDSITLLYNDGQGGMSARAVLPVQSGAVALAAGNLDADGHVDLVVANRYSNSVTVLRNDRDGSFVTSAHYPVGVSPTDVALADVDGDGDVDIAVSAAGTRSVALLRNDGNGTFTTATGPQSTSLRPAALAADGLTADVLNDLVAGGNGDFIVFFENVDGTTFERQDVDTGFPVRDVQLVDLDDNRVTDLVVLSADSARVQVFHNRLAGRHVPPRPPAHLVAADVPQDLGGRIVLTWEDGDYGTRLPADQVIATTAYTVVRAADADFVDPDTLGSVPGGTRSFTDDAATPYQAFYYRVTASRGTLQSAPSAPVSAVSLPAPLVDLKLSNAPRISRGDTLRVQVYLTPAQHRLAGVSVFLSYEPTALQLLPTPGDTTRPFRVSQDLTGAFTPAINAYHDGRTVSGQLDLTLISTAPGGAGVLAPGVEPVLLGEVWFRASRQVSTFISIDDAPAANRGTAVVEDSTGRWIEPVLGDTTRLTVRDVFVSGEVSPQSRAPSALAVDEATLLFIDGGGDTLASSLNDADRLAPGIQVPLDESGRFFLDQIPTGTYRVFAKVATHLQGLVVGDTVTVDSSRRHLTFRWVGPDSSFTAALPAGDANDDNRVNLADFGVLVRYYGRTTSSADWDAARAANFDGDQEVGITDFLLLADNFGRVGMEVVPAARAAGDRRGRVWSERDGDTEVLRAADVGALRGLSLRLPAGVDADVAGTVFGGVARQLQVWPEGQGVRLALALSAEAAVAGDGVLLRLGEPGSVPAASLATLELLDGAGRVFRPAVVAAAPLASALHANYPNPFNPATQIPFDLGGVEPAAVRLEIFDVLGQRVRVLLDDPALAPGRYRLTWDARDGAGAAVASGIYFARLTTPDTRATHRLLLVR